MQIEISEYSKKGYGIARTPKKVEVARAIKGETILVELKRRGATLLEVVKPSESRVKARCPHADVCGGCIWQELDYSAQLAVKHSQIESLFDGHPVEPIVGMDDPWAYRAKMEFTFSQNKAGDRFLGLIMRESRGKVFNLEVCSIAHPWVAQVTARVREWWYQSGLLAYLPMRDEGSLRTLTLRTNRDGTARMAILTISGNPDYALSRDQMDAFVKAVGEEEGTSAYMIIQSIAKGRPTQFFEMHLSGPAYLEEQLFDQTLQVGPRSFFQPNTVVRELLFKRAIELLTLNGEEKVLDLYCGIATIGITLAPYVRQVIGVEESREAIDDAKLNIERLGLENIQVYAEDAGAFLERLGDLFTPDIVILDPPRSGLQPKAIAAVLKIAPEKIL